MNSVTFLGITRLGTIPRIDLTDNVEVSGKALILDSLGNEVEITFNEATANNCTSMRATDSSDYEIVDYDGHEDGAAYVSGDSVLYLDDMLMVEGWITSAIDRVEMDAQLAAADAWNAVWIDAAAAAETRTAR